MNQRTETPRKRQTLVDKNKTKNTAQPSLRDNLGAPVFPNKCAAQACSEAADTESVLLHIT